MLTRYTFNDGFELIAQTPEEAIKKYKKIRKNRSVKNRPVEELNSIANDLYDRENDFEFNYFSEDELVTLWVECCTKGKAYDDEVFEAISNLPNSRELFDRAKEIVQKNKVQTESLNEDAQHDAVYEDFISIADFLEEKEFYNYDLADYEMYPMETRKITFEIYGDWKYDHLYFDSLLEEWAIKNGRNIVRIDNEEIGESEEDYYDAYHIVYIAKDKDSYDTLNSMRSLFSEGLNEARYSDHYDDETKQKGWWYFTVHGVQPGSIPKDLNVLEIRDGENRKGTKGTFVRLDGILNTDELDFYGMKEEPPLHESVNWGTSWIEEFYKAEDGCFYKELKSKTVPDSEGATTDYTLYVKAEPDSDEFDMKYVCVFGDKDSYKPENSELDFETNNIGEANDWFENYDGFDEKVADIEVEDNGLEDIESEEDELELDNNTNESLTEDFSDDYVILSYSNLYVPDVVIRAGNPSGRFDTGAGQWYPDDDETDDYKIDYSYEVEKDEVIDCLVEEVMFDEDIPEEVTVEEITKKITDNFDEYFDKYEQNILDYFEDSAVEQAREELEEEMSYMDNDDYYEERDDFDESLSLSEMLNRIDHKTLDKGTQFYDLRSFYESVEKRLTAQDKNDLKNIISNVDDPKAIEAAINAKLGKDEEDKKSENNERTI